ncbi:class I SAM-dependent methyltransferase [Paracoccus methylarcula]|uniref:Class I SAM-dependent methyltransferase n=1 Tax=Paracoccus methylarcula TaxID=72022 RepID=A0A422R0Z3_9RHOB|nr:class I SAM-dependent methyltransferase [Paracoccus methylarcula]RNF35872.1 class I SAM-dependent methyltransferase [Paracoccus methylarcula]
MRNVTLDNQSLITPLLISNELTKGGIASSAPEIVKAQEILDETLDDAEKKFRSSMNVDDIVGDTSRRLHELRSSLDYDTWKNLIPIAQEHPVAEFFLQDPFTNWSFTKPRGYSGDAHLLDFIYEHPNVRSEVQKASSIGRKIYAYTKDASSSIAVRERRDLLTRYIDEIASTRGKDTEILTIAAGHLREASRSNALRDKKIRRWIALDQDPLSVESIDRDFKATCVEAVEGSVRSLLRNAHGFGKFDFIYAAGLYDYLPDKVAVKLTQHCLNMLKPNGVFLFANFARDIMVDGYMEAFMNWALLLRTEIDMSNIITASATHGSAKSDVYFGNNRNIVYGVIKSC